MHTANCSHSQLNT